MKAMARDPAERYASVKELRDEINAYMSGFAPAAQHAGPLRRIALFAARHWTTFLLVLAAALIAALLWMVMTG